MANSSVNRVEPVSSTYWPAQRSRRAPALGARDQRHTRAHARGVPYLNESLQGKLREHADADGARNVDVTAEGSRNDDLIQGGLSDAGLLEQNLQAGAHRPLRQLNLPDIAARDDDVPAIARVRALHDDELPAALDVTDAADVPAASRRARSTMPALSNCATASNMPDPHRPMAGTSPMVWYSTWPLSSITRSMAPSAARMPSLM